MSGLSLVHYWISFGALVLLILATIVIGLGLSMPKASKRGDTAVALGLTALIAVTAMYLVYAATAVLVTLGGRP